MAALSIGLSGSGIANGSKNYNITDPVVTKMVAWGRLRFPVAAPDTSTAAQVLVLIFDAQIKRLRDALTKVDSDAAYAAVIVTPVDIS